MAEEVVFTRIIQISVGANSDSADRIYGLDNKGHLWVLDLDNCASGEEQWNLVINNDSPRHIPDDFR